MYEVLDPPEDAFSTDSYVGFKTPSDTEIKGYIIYYKIYDDADEETITSDRRLFDPIQYENDKLTEIPVGIALPVSLGFFPMGYVGGNSFPSPHIPLVGDNREVRIDFSYSGSQLDDVDPSLFIDNTDVSGLPEYGYPARGVKYSDNPVSSDYENDTTLKRFVRNYEYEPGDADADIQEMLDSYPSPTNIKIAFVAISYGISDTTLEQLMSIPVHIGIVKQSNFADNDTDKPR